MRCAGGGQAQKRFGDKIVQFGYVPSRSEYINWLKQGTVVEVPVVGFDLRRKIYMIRPQIQFASRAIEAFWSFVHDPINTDLLRMAER